jgi:hypothetical protein
MTSLAVSMLALAGLALASRARAEEMTLTLGRLSEGECARTLSDADDFALRVDGVQVLAIDRAAYAQLVSQISGALAPNLLAPVTTRGPSGFDIGLETAITDLDQGADAWRRGTRGSGGTPATCDGRNRDVRSVLTQNRLRFVKGLPLGISLGGSVGFAHGLALWTLGTELKVAIIEGALNRWLPDLAVRVASNSLVGDGALSLSSFAFDLLASREFPVAHVMQIVPYVALGAVLSRARSGTVDLTPNVDANACLTGTDPVCNAHGLGASSDDLGHDQAFPKLLLMRYRAVLGLWLRYRVFAFAVEGSFDLVRPDRADSDLPAPAPRQWSVQFAPSLSF